MNYTDLLGVPWEQMNCGEVAVIALDRLGLGPAAEVMPTDQERATRLLEAQNAPWVCVSSDVRDAVVGDVIVSTGPVEGFHVSLVIRPGLAISSARRVGVYATPVTRITQTQGVYRFQP